MPVSTESLLGRSLRGTEAHLYNLASNLWSLHYLRLTNQLESDVMYRAFDAMNVELAGLMRLFDYQGSFRLQTHSKPSVWFVFLFMNMTKVVSVFLFLIKLCFIFFFVRATAWVVRVLGQSQFQDWENYYYVDRRLLSTAVEWLLTYQNPDGTFEETHDYPFPLDTRLVVNNNLI